MCNKVLEQAHYHLFLMFLSVSLKTCMGMYNNDIL